MFGARRGQFGGAVEAKFEIVQEAGHAHHFKRLAHPVQALGQGDVNEIIEIEAIHGAQLIDHMNGGEFERLAQAVGFRYQYDAETGLYLHASGIMVLTPEGKLARYFYGVDYAPKDVRLGLIEASQNKIGSAVDQLLLLCYQYDPSTGKYGLVIMNSLRIAGGLTVVTMVGFIVIMLRRERREKPHGPLGPPA